MGICQLCKMNEEYQLQLSKKKMETTCVLRKTSNQMKIVVNSTTINKWVVIIIFSMAYPMIVIEM